MEIELFEEIQLLNTWDIIERCKEMSLKDIKEVLSIPKVAKKLGWSDIFRLCEDMTEADIKELFEDTKLVPNSDGWGFVFLEERLAKVIIYCCIFQYFFRKILRKV